MATSVEEGSKPVKKRVSKYSSLGHLWSPGWLQSLEDILPCRWKKSRSYKVDVIRSATLYLKWLQIGDYYLSRGLGDEPCSITADELEELAKRCGGNGGTKKKGRCGRGKSSNAVRSSPSVNEVTSTSVTEGVVQSQPCSADETKLHEVIEPPVLCTPADPMWSYSSAVAANPGRDNQASGSGYEVGMQDGTKAVVYSVYDDKSQAVSSTSPIAITSALIPNAGGHPNTVFISSQAESPLRSVMSMDLFPPQHFHKNNGGSPVHAQAFQWISRAPPLSPWQTLSPTTVYPDSFLSTCRTFTPNTVYETPSYHYPTQNQGWSFGTNVLEPTSYHSSFNQGVPVTLVADAHDGMVYQPTYNQGWTSSTAYENESYHNVDNRQGWSSGADVLENSSQIPTYNQEWTLGSDMHGNTLYQSYYGQGYGNPQVVQVESNGVLNTGHVNHEDNMVKTQGPVALHNEKIKVKKVKIASNQVNLNPHIMVMRKSGIHTEKIDGSQQLSQSENKENLNEITIERVRHKGKDLGSVGSDARKIMPTQTENIRQPLTVINS